VLFNRSTRLRIRRRFRMRRRQVKSATKQASEQLEGRVIDRLDRLVAVRQFLAGWLLLVSLLIFCTIVQTLGLSRYYQTVQPIPGGIYTEGIVGNYSNASPIYATGSVDTAVSRLIFAGLLTYDNQNKLVGDLATGYSVDQTGKHYTVKLRPHLTWQDGQPLTAADVVFTYQLIQNPDAGSPLLSSWQGIVVTAVDTQTIQFDLPNALSAFPYALTRGIVPQHILASVPPRQLRSNNFNTVKPVGAGPFSWNTIQIKGTDPETTSTLIALKPFKHYHGGAPKLDGYVVRSYSNQDQMVAAFERNDIMAMAGLRDFPKKLSDDHAHSDNFPLTAAVMTFFKTSTGILADAQVRQALVRGADVGAIQDGLGYSTKPVREPLLLGQVGYDFKYQQAGYDQSAAAAQLAAAGWIPGKDGVRVKNGQSLRFALSAEDTSENRYVVRQLASQWRKIGVVVDPVLQSATDLQTTLEFHNYDALLYGISIGIDPDVFVYWDSSQTDIRSNNRLNFSEWKSTTADTSLEAGRTRSDPVLRAIKYRSFLSAWQSEAPALGLYQPRFLYVTNQPVHGLDLHTLNSDTDRYNSVSTWQIREAKVTNQ